jgi:ArsR family transcriptional regulator
VTSPGECVEPDERSVVALDDERIAAMTKALGHPVRLRIVRLLSERHTCVSDLAAEFPLAQSTVSEHLRVLRDAGLIQGEIEGVRTSYCVNVAALAALKASLDAL